MDSTKHNINVRYLVLAGPMSWDCKALHILQKVCHGNPAKQAIVNVDAHVTKTVTKLNFSVTREVTKCSLSSHQTWQPYTTLLGSHPLKGCERLNLCKTRICLISADLQGKSLRVKWFSYLNMSEGPLPVVKPNWEQKKDLCK